MSRRSARPALAAALVSCTLVSGTVLAQDITAPTDPVTPSSDNHPAGEAAPLTIDNRARTKYLNFDELNTGLTITPSGAGPVVGLGLISANDAVERDPASYVLEGTNDGATFTPISSGMIPAFTQRFELQQFAFPNTTNYTSYRLTFPTVANPDVANSMQIAEVQLLRGLDVTSAADTVLASSANNPTNESPAMLVDDRLGTKWLNFDKQNTSVTIIPAAGPTVLNGVGIFSANDADVRDPASVIIEGSSNGTDFVTLAEGPTAFTDRQQLQEFLFDNTTAYTSYRFTFPDVRDPAAATAIQISEIQLYGTVVPEPSAAGLLCLVALPLLRRRRAK